MRSILVGIGNTIASVSFVGFVATAIFMVYLWVSALGGWLGWPGLVAGLLLAPLAVLFPFVQWLVEGVFPSVYFGLWVLGFVGLAISLAWLAIRRETLAESLPHSHPRI